MRISALLLIVLFCFCSVISYGQRDRDLRSKGSRNTTSRGRSSYDESCPRLYLGLNMGINNPNGLVGISLDIPVVDHFSLSTGIGRSSWGWKYFGEARGYLKHCHRGLAVGAGVTRNTGLINYTAELPTTQGDQMVTMDLEPQLNAFLNLYLFTNMGKRNNRFGFYLGYSHRLEEPTIVIKSGDVLTADGEAIMNLLAPGGVSIGVGFYFDVLSTNDRR
jgi:hypothetical protein